MRSFKLTCNYPVYAPAYTVAQATKRSSHLRWERVSVSRPGVYEWLRWGQACRATALSPSGHVPVERNETAPPWQLLKQWCVCVWPRVPAALDRRAESSLLKAWMSHVLQRPSGHVTQLEAAVRRVVWCIRSDEVLESCLMFFLSDKRDLPNTKNVLDLCKNKPFSWIIWFVIKLLTRQFYWQKWSHTARTAPYYNNKLWTLSFAIHTSLILDTIIPMPNWRHVCYGYAERFEGLAEGWVTEFLWEWDRECLLALTRLLGFALSGLGWHYLWFLPWHIQPVRPAPPTHRPYRQQRNPDSEH